MNFVTNLFKGLSTKDKEQLEKKKDISTTTNTNTDGVVEDGKNAYDTKLPADDNSNVSENAKSVTDNNTISEKNINLSIKTNGFLALIKLSKAILIEFLRL